jgi:hypothetical protein
MKIACVILSAVAGGVTGHYLGPAANIGMIVGTVITLANVFFSQLESGGIYGHED